MTYREQRTHVVTLFPGSVQRIRRALLVREDTSLGPYLGIACPLKLTGRKALHATHSTRA